MSFEGPFGITATNAVRAFNSTLKTKAQGVSAASAVAVTSIEKARAQLKIAAGAFVQSFLELSGTRRTLFHTSFFTTAGTAARILGQSARLNPVIGESSVIQATRRINTVTDTERTSSTLGLDLSGAAASVLSSAALGLDVASPSAPSRLGSSSALGLDLTTPASASRLTSSAALGLDLTSPDAPSALRSSTTLGLDVTSPETASVLRSSAALALDISSAQSASTITSTAEMNAAPTSYGSTQISFSGSGAATTSVATLSGTYTGVGTAANATSLTIKIRKNAGLPPLIPSSLKFDVLDNNNTVLFSYDDNIAANTPIYLGADIGLTVSFSSGSFTNNHTGTTTVSHSATTVDANATFNNANVNLRPRFENGAQVTAGSFTINGTSVTVNATDTINTVVSRINASAAGVTASVSGDKVTLTTNANSEDAITLANDTSGFLAAVKLSAATTTRGNIRDDQQVLAKTTQFAAVTNGGFTINGVSIAVDKDADSLSSVISRINSAGAGVSAAYDSVLDRLMLTGSTNSEELIAVASDTSGFLTAAKLVSSNTVLGNLRDDQQMLAKTTQFAAVATGAFTINGVSIAVDKDADSLSSVISRINAANAGVTALYDSVADRLVLTGTTNSQSLIAVAGDTSGFLTAARLATANTERGHLAEDGVALADITQFQSVVDGSFVIDGQTIAVSAATDSVQSIVDKINQSGARVAASYDSVTDRIALLATYDSEDDVPIGSDTSGFLSAANLAANATVRGNLRDDLQVLSKTSQFGAVTSGTFTLNGTTITIDTATDTLASVVSQINSAGAGVTATIDETTDTLQLVTTADSEDGITVADDTTGFLSSAGFDTNNTTRGNLADDVQVLENTSQFAAVTNGTFTINGATIAVDVASDTIQSIVDKINTSAAGVTASYDSNADKIVLTSDTATEDAIVVDGDSTGFLSAAGLSTTNTARGNISDDLQVLSKTSQFSGVTTGSFRVNDIAIAVDADMDSMADVVARINAANAGVTASYDSTNDRLVFTPSVAGAALSIDEDTTGFLDAIGVMAGAMRDHVDSAAAFNATGLSSAFLDPGMNVTAGAFSVNGVPIDVDADDSIDSVLAKITASNAGVIASYDDTTQTVRLVSTDPTSSAIALGADTSGFLAAVKLDGSEQNTSGRDTTSAFDAALANVAEYSGVQAGTVTINGTTINVDPSTTTLRDFVSALDGIDGISATVDETTGDVRLLADRTNLSIAIADTSSLLATLGISIGEHKGTPAVRRETKVDAGTELTSNATSVVANLNEATKNLNEALARLGPTLPLNSRERTAVDITMRETLAALSNFGVSGLRYESDRSGMRFVVDRPELTRSLNASSVDFAEMFAGYSQAGGALGAFLDTLTQLAAGSAPATTRSARALSIGDLTARIKRDVADEQNLTALQLAVRSTLLSQGATTQAAAAQIYASVERRYSQYRGG